MRRHVKTVHADDETIDDRENPESIKEDDASDKADDVESNIQDDSDDNVKEEEGKEEDSDDPWRLLIEEAFERCQSEFDERVTEHMARQGVDEEDARKRVYDNMLTNLQESVGERFR